MRNEEWAALLCCKVILHSSFKSSYFLVLIIRISNQYKENQSDHSYYLSGTSLTMMGQLHKHDQKLRHHQSQT